MINILSRLVDIAMSRPDYARRPWLRPKDKKKPASQVIYNPLPQKAIDSLTKILENRSTHGLNEGKRIEYLKAYERILGYFESQRVYDPFQIQEFRDKPFYLVQGLEAAASLEEVIGQKAKIQPNADGTGVQELGTYSAVFTAQSDDRQTEQVH